MNKDAMTEIGDFLGMIELESVCAFCHGAGGHDGLRGRVRCMNCKGAGHVPTNFGEKVIAIMRHNLAPILQDLRDD